MDIASLVLGILGLVFGFIPFCSYIAPLLCLIGLILGIVSVVQKSKYRMPKGMAIAGVILSAIGLVVSFAGIIALFAFLWI